MLNSKSFSGYCKYISFYFIIIRFYVETHLICLHVILFVHVESNYYNFFISNKSEKDRNLCYISLLDFVIQIQDHGYLMSLGIH